MVCNTLQRLVHALAKTGDFADDGAPGVVIFILRHLGRAVLS